jgi:uncharacterized protein YfcZ (UPF0381/DUF406 family)
MKQQYKGTHTFDVASRTITLLGIEILPERLLLVVNSTVGFVYHNFAADPNADITITGGNTVIVFPQYKDCDTHRATDALSIFYDDGVDLGKLIKDESDQTQVILTDIQAELEDANSTLTAFKAEVKSESDDTQVILSEIKTELDTANSTLSDFKTEAKAESDSTQNLLGTKLPDPVDGRIPVETLGKYEPTNNISVNMTYGSFGMSQVVFSKAGTTLKTLNMNYDAEGNLVSVIPT